MDKDAFLRPGRLWSLWDMLGLLFGPFQSLLEALKLHADILKSRRAPHTELPKNIRDAKVSLIDLGQYLEELELSESVKRANRIIDAIDKDAKPLEISTQITYLLETVADEAESHAVFSVPPRKGDHLFHIQGWNARGQNEWPWDPVWKSFPDAQSDIESALTCYCIEENTACVFHLMRVLETGLAKMATEVGRTFEHQQWHNIIEEIESAIEAERKKPGNPPDKRERLKFLSEAAKEFFYFKDGWRNYVSHKRVPYDEHQALSAIEHVRSFMTVLAKNLTKSP